MDGIALNDVARTDKARSRNDALETYVVLIVSENGVESMEAFPYTMSLSKANLRIRSLARRR